MPLGLSGGIDSAPTLPLAVDAPGGFPADTVRRVVLQNEFKRRPSAPGPRVTTRAFGHERRYPITSGWH